ncbi:MAG: glycosyltransferase [Acidobacteriota bacterium]
MRILILDTYYPEPLGAVYENNPGLDGQPYDKQLQTVYDYGFGRGNSFPANLRKLGHEADQFIVNGAALQRGWAAEHGVEVGTSGLQHLARRGYRSVRWRLGFRKGLNLESWEQTVIAAQVENFDPEVIIFADVLPFSPAFLKKLRTKNRLLVGEIGYPIPDDFDLSVYDLILSCAPVFVDKFRRAGLKSELFRLGFDSAILNKLNGGGPQFDAVFLGTVGSLHSKRTAMLEELARRVPISCFGYCGDSLPADSPLRSKIQPPLWGYEMYRMLQRSRIAVNMHIDIAENSAANIRLYEATGVGTLLLTDWKSNLPELFDVGREVVAYKSAAECAEKISYYLAHEEERAAIAAAGQRRTLKDHTIERRMQELVSILEPYYDDRQARQSIRRAG